MPPVLLRVAGLLLLVQVYWVYAAKLRGQRAIATRSAGETTRSEAKPCSCSHCHGQRVAGGALTELQCTNDIDVSAGDSDTCEQRGTPTQWVVQTAQVLPYTRFCLYSCKPEVSEAFASVHKCVQLTGEEMEDAQSASGNGRSFVYNGNPMVSSPTLADVPDPSNNGPVVADGRGSNPDSPAKPTLDAVSLMRKAFAIVKKAGGRKNGNGCPCPCDSKAPDEEAHFPTYAPPRLPTWDPSDGPPELPLGLPPPLAPPPPPPVPPGLPPLPFLPAIVPEALESPSMQAVGDAGNSLASGAALLQVTSRAQSENRCDCNECR